LSQTRISLLIELLKSFTEKELTTFSKFVESAYFNEDQKLIGLLKKIKRYALKAEKFTPELQLRVYEETYSEKPLKQKELSRKQYVFLNNKQHKLLRLAEKFLVIENLSTKKTLNQELLYKPLIDRNQNNLYKRHLKNDTKKLENETKHGIDYYAAQYKLQEATLEYLIKNGQITQKDNYNELQHYLDINYVLEKLKYHLAQITLKNDYVNKNYEFSALSEMASLLKKPQFAKNPLVQIYLSNINLVETQSDEAYHNLKETLRVNQNKLPAIFLRVFYIILANYCSAQIRSGNIEYFKNVFEIYKTMHQQNLLMIENLLDVILFKNVIIVACTINEFEWADTLLEEYKKIIFKIEESIYFYNKGVIAFHKKNYALAQDWFLKTENINESYEISLRIFILQCIYETEPDYNDATKQSFQSAKQFFNRNLKLHSKNKISHLNFITIFTGLYKYKHQVTKVTLLEIKDKMSNMNLIHKKKWLIDKINELE